MSLASRLKKAAAAARDSAFSSVNTAASSVWSAGNTANTALEDSESEEQEDAEDEDHNSADADDDSLRRIAYIAVSRNGDMLAEVADRETLEVERDFAVALGRKMIRRKASAGWDEMSGGRHHVIRLPLHDSAGSTSYIVCFSHGFPSNLAQAFAQKLSLMLDPMIEKCSEITESLLESTILVILPVLERELERANAGVKTHLADSLPLPQEVKSIILQNIEVMLERDRSLKRQQLEKQTKFIISVCNAKKKAGKAQDKAQGEAQDEAQSDAQGNTQREPQSEAGPASQDAAGESGGAPNAEKSDAGKQQQESKESQQEPQPILQPGVAVIMHGLTAAADLNGRPGQCEQWVAESGRWRVRLESGEHKDIKSGNLALQSTQTVPSMEGKQLLRKGVAVVIHGLSGAKELNGLKAQCEQWLEESGRWRVRLESGEHKDIKPGSLALQSAQPDASTSGGASAAASDKAGAASAPNSSATQGNQGSFWFKPKQRKKAPSPTKPPPEPPVSPRTRARKLVGDRLGAAQAERAAELILKLEPYVDGKRTAYIDDIWTFFDVPKPAGNSFNEGDSTSKSLKGKLNRQRLLLHPDKNGHPQAEKTFKFLEQCNQRLQDTCMRGGRRESARQRTQREEEEREEEELRRRKQEAEWKAAEEKRRKEEDEKARREEEEAEKARIEQEKKDQRLDWLRRQASELSQGRAERAAWQSRQNSLLGVNTESRPAESRPSKPDLPEIAAEDFIPSEEDPSELGDISEAPPLQPPPSQAGIGQPSTLGPAQDQASKPSGVPLACQTPGEPVGKLTLTVIAAKDLPAGNWMMETKTYAVAGVGSQRFQTEVLPGTCPAWGSTFEFDVRMEDRGLFVGVWREGWGFRLLGDDFLGRVEIPFLDLEDWGGCVIGRMLESADPDISECMHLELKASIDWF